MHASKYQGKLAYSSSRHLTLEEKQAYQPIINLLVMVAGTGDVMPRESSAILFLSSNNLIL